MESALTQEQPFTVVLQRQGIDSIVRTGWVGADDGTVYMLSYDSNVCGGGGGCSRSCGPRVSRATCITPTVAGPDEVIDCGSRESEELCGPPS